LQKFTHYSHHVCPLAYVHHWTAVLIKLDTIILIILKYLA
jgi:hypothetical protein